MFNNYEVKKFLLFFFISKCNLVFFVIFLEFYFVVFLMIGLLGYYSFGCVGLKDLGL